MRFGEKILFDYNSHPVITVFHSVVTPQKRIYRAHHHTECEISLFISGNGIYKTEQKEYTFNKGDVFLFGSNEVHCITDIYTDVELLNIHFEPHMLWENSETTDLLMLFHSRNEKFSNKISDDKLLSEFLIKTEEELILKKKCYKLTTKNTLCSALVHIIRNYDFFLKNNNFSSNADFVNNLKESMNYINNNLENKLTLQEISKSACMSPTYFSAVFKKYNGISPWEYITIKRVEKAIKMLKTSKMTKLEIAERCGFSSSSNFYKAFFNITGKKPNDYIPSE